MLPSDVPRRSARVLLSILALSVALSLVAGSRSESSSPRHATARGRPARQGFPADLGAALSIERIVAHMRALEEIALTSGGDRATGTEGYERSVDYVEARLREAGLEPERAEVEYDHFTRRAPAEVVVGRGASGSSSERWREPGALRTLTHSASGDVAGPLAPAGNGCAAESWAAVERGAIALVERGGCTFAEKARRAGAAGAAALVVAPPRRSRGSGPVRGTLLAPAPLPVVGATRALAEGLSARLAAAPVELRVRVDTASERRRSASVVADTKAGDPREVVVLGAHLDSVIGSPGVDDNAAAVGLLLELARLLGERRDFAHTVRFAFWTGEEKRLLGSRAYVAGLSEAERERIALYLNLDMIASPNFVRIVYDGDGTAGGPPWPEGSATIEQAFREQLADRGLAVEERDVTGRSDHAAFVDAGIASGGVGSFVPGDKTAAQARLFGGEAGAALQPCYHRACDTLEHTSPVVLAEIARATARVVARFAAEAVPVPYARRAAPPTRSRAARVGLDPVVESEKLPEEMPLARHDVAPPTAREGDAP